MMSFNIYKHLFLVLLKHNTISNGKIRSTLEWLWTVCFWVDSQEKAATHEYVLW